MFMIKTNTGFVKLNGSVNNSKHIELLSNKIKKNWIRSEAPYSLVVQQMVLL